MKTIIFGTTHFAEMMYYYMADAGREPAAFTVNEQYISGKIMSKPVIPFEQIKKYYTSEEYEILPAVGYFDMNDRRKYVFEQIKNKGYKIGTFVHESSVVAKNVKLNEGTIILENCVIQPFVTLGKGNILFSNVNIAHNSVIGNFNWFAPCASVGGGVTIGNNCFVGVNSTIRNEIHIEDYTLVGAGSYVRKSTASNQVVKCSKSEYISDMIYNKF